MYKLLLVSDREEVLSAFSQIDNWELIGFKPPHIRHDFEGTIDSLQKHHADGIAIAVEPAEEEQIINYLTAYYPNIAIFEAGRDPEEVLRYLSELKILLNRIHADFSNDNFGTTDILQECRHEFFRKLMKGKVQSKEDLRRNMRLLRSKMDADKPCILVRLVQPAQDDDKLEGRWHYGSEQLEYALRKAFAGDVKGLHILPTVSASGEILILACPLHAVETQVDEEDIAEVVQAHIDEGIRHLSEYKGLDLSISGIRVLPALYALCGDANIGI